MTRTTLPLQVDDLSGLARSLRQQLADAGALPSHLGLMNMIARSAGFRNHQHLRASALAGQRIEAAREPAPDLTRVEQVLRHFDSAGRLANWPAKTWQQHLALWALWSRLPAQTTLTERQISALLNDWHSFSDAAILRRTLAELKLVSRTPDGSAYQRLERAPSPEAAALIRALRARQKAT